MVEPRSSFRLGAFVEFVGLQGGAETVAASPWSSDSGLMDASRLREFEAGRAPSRFSQETWRSWCLNIAPYPSNGSMACGPPFSGTFDVVAAARALCAGCLINTNAVHLAKCARRFAIPACARPAFRLPDSHVNAGGSMRTSPKRLTRPMSSPFRRWAGERRWACMLVSRRMWSRSITAAGNACATRLRGLPLRHASCVPASIIRCWLVMEATAH